MRLGSGVSILSGSRVGASVSFVGALDSGAPVL
jgi:hypothetical protein